MVMEVTTYDWSEDDLCDCSSNCNFGPAIAVTFFVTLLLTCLFFFLLYYFYLREKMRPSDDVESPTVQRRHGNSWWKWIRPANKNQYTDEPVMKPQTGSTVTVADDNGAYENVEFQVEQPNRKPDRDHGQVTTEQELEYVNPNESELSVEDWRKSQTQDDVVVGVGQNNNKNTNDKSGGGWNKRGPKLFKPKSKRKVEKEKSKVDVADGNTKKERIPSSGFNESNGPSEAYENVEFQQKTHPSTNCKEDAVEGATDDEVYVEPNEPTSSLEEWRQSLGQDNLDVQQSEKDKAGTTKSFNHDAPIISTAVGTTQDEVYEVPVSTDTEYTGMDLGQDEEEYTEMESGERDSQYMGAVSDEQYMVLGVTDDEVYDMPE
ncbi:uncharacterized protein LOC144350471 [Saccoglossus kowalevskii]